MMTRGNFPAALALAGVSVAGSTAAHEPPASKILITGARGTIGSVLHAAYPDAVGIDIEDGDLTRTIPDLAVYGTVIHLAGILKEDIEAEAANGAITLNMLRACRMAPVRRLIWASSLLAAPGLVGMPETYYSAGKAAQECLLRAWAAEDPQRIAVAMRYGHFRPGSKPPVSHEVLRLDERALLYWIGQALALDTPGVTTWSAVGRLG